LAKSKLVIFDLDCTLTQKDTFIPYLLGFLRRNPCRLGRTLRLPWCLIKFLIRLETNEQLKEGFLATFLGGVKRQSIEIWSEVYVDKLLSKGLKKQAVEELKYHRAMGSDICIVSASLDIYVTLLAHRLGIKKVICTCAEYVGNRLSGRLASKNCYGKEKVRRLEEMLGKKRNELYIIAYADHISDIPLLKWADRGIMVGSEAAMQNHLKETNIEARNWR
jgi:phosphatidylglycerophosphatase C